jgi:hypothetical protein
MTDPVVFENGYVAFTTGTATGAAYTEVAGVKSIRLSVSRADLDDAVMGDALEAKYPGILSAPLALECRQDFTTQAAGVDKLSSARLIGRTAFKVKVRAVDAAVADDNPSYIWTRVSIFNTSPIDGKHGELLVNKIDLKPRSGCAFSRSSST